MIKSLSLLTRKDGTTHEQFVTHWVEVHAPLAHRVPGLVRYVQSHIVEERTRPDIPSSAVEIDGIAELWYEDGESMARALASPEAKALHADGARFIGRIKTFTVEEKVILSRPPSGPRGIHAVREHLAKLPPAASLTTAQRRAQYDRAERVFPTPADVAIETVKAPAQPAEWLRPPGVATDAVVLYLHGGGYVIGSPRSHRHLAAAIAHAAGTQALLLDYRLAPEHPFPAALDDALAAYQWLLGHGIAPGRIVVAGDSAGGGLTVATLLALRDRGLPRPAGGVCISPWVDLTGSGASYATKASADPIVTRDGIAGMAQAYVGNGDLKAPLVSPLYADLRNLPPLLIQVGSEEVLLDDALGLGAHARVAGVDVTVEEWPAMIHVWHWFLPMLEEAERAIATIGGFVRARLG